MWHCLTHAGRVFIVSTENTSGSGQSFSRSRSPAAAGNPRARGGGLAAIAGVSGSHGGLGSKTRQALRGALSSLPSFSNSASASTGGARQRPGRRSGGANSGTAGGDANVVLGEIRCYTPALWRSLCAAAEEEFAGSGGNANAEVVVEEVDGETRAAVAQLAAVVAGASSSGREDDLTIQKSSEFGNGALQVSLARLRLDVQQSKMLGDNVPGFLDVMRVGLSRRTLLAVLAGLLLLAGLTLWADSESRSGFGRGHGGAANFAARDGGEPPVGSSFGEGALYSRLIRNFELLSELDDGSREVLASSFASHTGGKPLTIALVSRTGAGRLRKVFEAVAAALDPVRGRRGGAKLEGSMDRNAASDVIGTEVSRAKAVKSTPLFTTEVLAEGGPALVPAHVDMLTSAWNDNYAHVQDSSTGAQVDTRGSVFVLELDISGEPRSDAASELSAAAQAVDRNESGLVDAALKRLLKDAGWPDRVCQRLRHVVVV